MKPDINVGEITLLGTGGGYGESIVIHLGMGKWAVIDSCINPNTKSCLPMDYLLSIGVDLKKDVELILITHWHDDHIKGISKLYQACESATLAISAINDREMFLHFVGLEEMRTNSEASLTSTREFAACLKIIRGRRIPIKKASVDKVLKTVQLVNNGEVSNLLSLSPSDYAVELFDREISSLITEYGFNPNLRYTKKSPNHDSVAVIVQFGKHTALLGADLEVVQDDRLGWYNILANGNLLLRNSTLFKPSHHGSRNGMDPRIWSELLEEKPLTKITPYNKGHKLPTAEMLAEFQDKSNRLLLTSPSISKKRGKKRSIQIEKIISRCAKSLEESKFAFGRITCRIVIDNNDSVWQVTTDGSAIDILK